MTLRPRTGGFTLIELMIVVAIIGILATISISELGQMLLRSKRAELPMNLDAVRTAEVGYHAEWGEFTACALQPGSVGRQSQAFPATFTTNLDWNLLGWVPDGRVYGQYQVGVTGTGSLSGDDFTAEAFGDIDGDGNLSTYQANRAFKPVMLSANNVY